MADVDLEAQGNYNTDHFQDAAESDAVKSDAASEIEASIYCSLPEPVQPDTIQAVLELEQDTQIPNDTFKEFESSMQQILRCDRRQALLVALRFPAHEFKEAIVVEVPVDRISSSWRPPRRVVKLPSGERRTQKLIERPKDQSAEEIWRQIYRVWQVNCPRWYKYALHFLTFRVEEVNLRVRECSESGLMADVEYVSASEAREQAMKKREEASEYCPQYEDDFPCVGDYDIDGKWVIYHHGTRCPGRSLPFVECGEKMSLDAEERLVRLDHLHQYLECFKNPKRANSSKTLEGMAQDTCIYDRDELAKYLPGGCYTAGRSMAPQVRGLIIEVQYRIPALNQPMLVTAALVGIVCIILGSVTDRWTTAQSVSTIVISLIGLWINQNLQRPAVTSVQKS